MNQMQRSDPLSKNDNGKSWVSMLGWASGASCLSVPYNLYWKLGNGCFAANILITLILAAVGVILVIAPIGLSQRRSAESGSMKRCHSFFVCSFLISLLAVIGSSLFNWPWWIFVPVQISCLVAQWASVLFTTSRIQSQESMLKSWFRSGWKCNGLFWLLVFLLLVLSDIYVLFTVETDNAVELIGSSLGRLTTQAASVLGLIFVFQFVLVMTPRLFRAIVILIFSLLPFLVVTDFLLKQYWNHSLFTFVNSLTASGSFDLSKEIAASGLDMSMNQLFGIVLLVLIGSFILYFCSSLIRLRVTNRLIMSGALFCWILTVAESWSSHVYKRSEEWQRHYQLFSTHIGMFAPPAGFERMDVTFREMPSIPVRNELLQGLEDEPHLQKPDVYVFMIESWRSDSITPEVAPFLYRFRNEEAQDLGRTFAGSNCTPLSWFSMLHSRIAIHWGEAVKQKDGENGFAGAYPLKVLKQLGYEIQVRAVCDLNYRNLGPLNFGGKNYLADVILDDSEDDLFGSIPEREKFIMRDQREFINSDPESPQFHFTSLDSPHYNYYWPSDFEQLHENCANHLPGNLVPSNEAIGQVVRRYENAVHWMDYAIEEFVDFLKFKGRYDNSVIIITGDHGEEFQEEGSWFHCSSLNKYQTEVPIIIKWPEWVKDAPAQDNVSHYDVMPSLLNLIGLEPKYYEGLAGQSLFDYPESPREAVLSTVHRGESGIGVCLIGEGRKVKFSFPGPWSTNVPNQLIVCEYSDILDKPLDFRKEIGALTHTDYIRKQFPRSSSRFFERFEKHSSQ